LSGLTASLLEFISLLVFHFSHLAAEILTGSVNQSCFGKCNNTTGRTGDLCAWLEHLCLLLAVNVSVLYDRAKALSNGLELIVCYQFTTTAFPYEDFGSGCDPIISGINNAVAELLTIGNTEEL
jgi:hypothetical protein